MTERTVVLYPSLGVGHLNPMAQLAKAILRHGGVAITIAVVDPPEKHAVLAAAQARLAAVSPSITVHLLPIPPCASKQHSHPIVPILDALRTANPALRAFLASRVPAVEALVVDMFCTDALDVAAELAIPAYFLYPSAAGDLAVYLQIPDLCGAGPSSLKDMGKAALNFASVPAVRALDMPDTMQDWESDVGSVRLRQLARMPEAAGILVNSFEWLESRALKALRDGHCLPGRSTPKIYCVGLGPLVDGGDAEGNGERHACLEWMDGQPKQSVVFLCFGSLGAFSAAQLKETARGLERSGHRFLWALRSRSSREEQNSREPDLEALLPDGFLERTRGRGLVLKNWAPQTQVLRHEAVGVFVTHCGWNSVLEAVMSGVPMICWPLYAEQRLNKVHVVEEMKVGVVMEGYDEELVTADEVEAKVRLVMESEEGKKLRERTAMAKEMAADAIKGGSSHVELGEFLRGLGCK